MRRSLGLLTASGLMSVLLTACATVAPTPVPAPMPPATPAPVVRPEPIAVPAVSVPKPATPLRPATTPASPSAAPVPPADIVPLQFNQTAFENLPNWAETDVGAARRALVRSCAISQARPKDQLLSTVASYSGRVGDWAGVCALAQDPSLEDRSFWESQFQVWRVSTEATEIGRLTGYYEPIMAASRVKTPVFSEPIQSRPSDLFEIDLGQFDATLRNRAIVARMDRGKVVPYWSRAQINENTAPVLAWGEPAEVLSLQVQGSGRLQFDDGTQVRAAFAAHNGHRFGSNAQELIRRGALPVNGASMDAIKTWFKTASRKEAREVLNANPRTVFFQLEPIKDPSAGPKGGQQAALEANGSLAVDTSYHAYGVPIFLAADAPRVAISADVSLRRLVVAQDTGGAIRGPIRGDLYWGTGPEAGLRAGRINHDVRFWVLLPKGISPTSANSGR
ncbi:MltA domain-containing protein [Aquidulcibacter sp.]|uniref:murein transglycosylase A n=1 Tax=Aquidulcibacter sp. TaxID=2052990 RepID=UPI0025BBE158|nr:MltA domain-containing protein [Aquidulcibacter sp.]MCA3695941.1 MltA domain-containing protein [Aquidulcibacter sp.]